jgi:hypothetical protein
MQKLEETSPTDRVTERFGLDQLRTLRQGGLYLLPDGTEAIVSVGRGDSYLLYHPKVWKVGAWVISMPIIFEIRTSGQLFTGTGQPTSWTIDDLIDTSKTVEQIGVKRAGS